MATPKPSDLQKVKAALDDVVMGINDAAKKVKGLEKHLNKVANYLDSKTNQAYAKMAAAKPKSTVRNDQSKPDQSSQHRFGNRK